MKTTEWKCTDPDVNQWGRQLGEGIYEFYDDDTPYTVVKLADYTPEEKEEAINAYGYTLDLNQDKRNNFTYIKSLYPDDWEWIIAECIFELEQ